jgi:phosphate/sulfate permease
VYGAIVTVPWLRRTIIDKENLPWYTAFYTPCVGVGSHGYYEPEWETGKGGKSIEDGNVIAVSAEETVAGGNLGQEGESDASTLGKMIAPGFYMDIGAKREEDSDMHAAAWSCASQCEEMFKFLQLTSCCFFSLSHGANDVANAVGPFSAVWAIYSSGLVESKATVPIWVLVYGGLALDIGLLTMGHTIMAALGNRITLQTPSRGFCIELGAMFTVMVASRIGVPVSTTHCITGATVGVGLCNGNVKALNWNLLIVIFGGWVITCPMAGLMAGLAFWGVAGAPHPVPQNLYFGSEGSPWLNKTWAAVAYDLPFPPEQS